MGRGWIFHAASGISMDVIPARAGIPDGHQALQTFSGRIFSHFADALWLKIPF